MPNRLAVLKGDVLDDRRQDRVYAFAPVSTVDQIRPQRFSEWTPLPKYCPTRHGITRHLKLSESRIPCPARTNPEHTASAFHPRFVLRSRRPRRVDHGAVVLGEFGIRSVDLRVVEVRLVDAGLEVVRHQPGRDPAEEPERRDVALGPGALVHRQHRSHEQMTRRGQNHHNAHTRRFLPVRGSTQAPRWP
jgi:hypothetical protein